MHDEIELDKIDSHSSNVYDVYDEIELDQIDSHSSDGIADVRYVVGRLSRQFDQPDACMFPYHYGENQGKA